MNNFKIFVKNVFFIIGYTFIFFIIFNFICSLFVNELKYLDYTIHHSENRFITDKENVKDRYEVDNNGFRNLDSKNKFLKLKNKEFSNIIFLGGSTTFGYRVNDNETLPYHFEQIMKNNYEDKKINVVNLGSHNYSFRDNLYVLQSLLLDGYYPDLVIFYNGLNERYEIKDYIIFGNEKKWKHQQTGNNTLKTLYNSIGELHLENLSSFKVLKKIFKHTISFVDYRIIKKDIIYSKSKKLDANFINVYAESVANNYINILKAVDGLSITYNFKPLVFLQPTKSQYLDKKECWLKRKNNSSTFYRIENKKLREALTSLNIYYNKLYSKINDKVKKNEFSKLIYQDIKNIFLDIDCSENIIFISPQSHLNNFGNKFVAQTIYSYLKESDLLN